MALCLSGLWSILCIFARAARRTRDTVRRSPFGGVWFEVRSLRFGVRKVARSPFGGASIVLVLVVVLVLENGSGFGVWSLDSEFRILSSIFYLLSSPF